MRLRRAILRRAFNALYGSLARYYDLISSVLFLGEWRRWQMLGLKWARGPRLLEVGFGTGHVIAQASRRELEVFGVDSSRQMVEVARERLRRLGLPARLVRGSAEHLPFRDASFDTVLATFPTEYILKPESQVEMARVLKPGGRIVIVMTGELSPTTPLRKVLALLYRLIIGRLDETPGHLATSVSTLKGKWILDKSAGGRAAIFMADRPNQSDAGDPTLQGRE